MLSEHQHGDESKHPDDAELSVIITLQTQEISLFERRVKDHATAAKLQSYFNGLTLQEEKDAALVQHIGDATDVNAAACMRRQLNEMGNDDAQRIAQNEETINATKDDMSDNEEQLCQESRAKRICLPPPLPKESVIVKTSALKSTDVTCIICGENPKQFKSLNCGHSYCPSCMKDWFETALGDFDLLPLTCCTIRVDAADELARHLLAPAKAEKLIYAMEEKDCDNKMYCPNNECGVFIDLDKALMVLNIDNTFDCSRCYTSICYQCQSRKHQSNETCMTILQRREVEDAANLVAFQALGFQRCTNCKQMVELMYGCNHMTCVCRYEFCYSCGAGWSPRKCNCETIDMGRLQRDEDALIPANIVGDERARAVQINVRRARGQMIAEENCHHAMTRTNQYEFRANKPYCQVCNRRLNLFGYQCRCGGKECMNCYLHR